MPYSLWLPDAVADEFRGDRDVKFVTIPGWETRGRSSADHAGVLDHHMGAPPGSGYLPNVAYITDGPRFPPLANLCTSGPAAYDTRGIVRIDLVAAGRANHAGAGKLSWLSRDDGNRRMVGIEHWSWWSDGPDDWHPHHLEVQVRLACCLLEAMGQTWKRRADHKEYAPDRKTDRHDIDTADWDLKIRDRLHVRAHPTPAPPPPEEDIMATLDEVLDGIEARILPKIRTIATEEVERALNRDTGPDGDKMSVRDNAWRARRDSQTAAAAAMVAAGKPLRGTVRAELDRQQVRLERDIDEAVERAAAAAKDA